MQYDDSVTACCGCSSGSASCELSGLPMWKLPAGTRIIPSGQCPSRTARRRPRPRRWSAASPSPSPTSAATGACLPAPEAVNWSAYTPEDALRYGRWCNRSDRPDHPINCIDWELAAAYCAWRGGRLPTEAEWEYAARGSDDRVYPWGNEAPDVKRLNLCGRECAALAARELHDEWKPMYDGDDGWATTAPVGSYPDGASPFGVLDMAGNVWEWTDDWHGPYPATAQVDPRGPATGTSRVSRGAGWASRGPTRARGADRNWLDPKSRDCDLGFRCVQD